MVLGVFDIQAMESGGNGDGGQNPLEANIVKKRGRRLRLFRLNKKKRTEDEEESTTQLREDVEILRLQVGVGKLEAEVGEVKTNLQSLAGFVKSQLAQRQEETKTIVSMEEKLEQFGEALDKIFEGRDELKREVSGLRDEFHSYKEHNEGFSITLHEVLRGVKALSTSSSSATLTLSSSSDSGGSVVVGGSSSDEDSATSSGPAQPLEVEPKIGIQSAPFPAFTTSESDHSQESDSPIEFSGGSSGSEADEEQASEADEEQAEQLVQLHRAGYGLTAGERNTLEEQIQNRVSTKNIVTGSFVAMIVGGGGSEVARASFSHFLKK